MKTSIITITILFIVMATGHAYGQVQGGGCPAPLECKATDGGHNPTPGKGVKIGKLIFKAIGTHDSDGNDGLGTETPKDHDYRPRPVLRPQPIAKPKSGPRPKAFTNTTGTHVTFGQDETAPAARKRARGGKLVTINAVMSGDKCGVRDGGCTRPTFPPKKPKVPTRTGYFTDSQTGGVVMTLQTRDQGAKKKKETKKDSKAKTDKLNIPIFE